MGPGSRHEQSPSAVSFGDLVRRRRRILDLTQAALASRVGCSTATVKKIERGERRPSDTMARRIAEALDIPVGQRDAFVATGMGELAATRLVDQSRRSSRDPPPGVQVVGRDRELDLLQAHARHTLQSGARTVFVTGEAGQGKSSLLQAFARHVLLEHGDAVAARGYGTAANGGGDPYLLLRDVLGELLGVGARGRRADDVGDLQRDRVEAFAPFVEATLGRVAPGLARLVAPVLRVPAPTEAGSSSRDDLMGQAVAVLRALAEQRPLVLLLDDLQWSDGASMDLLFHLHRRLGDVPVLVVGAYRASDVTDGTSGPAATLRRLTLDVQGDGADRVVDLSHFEPAAARRLFDALVERELGSVDADLGTTLFWRTRGHPLFVLELVRELRDRGGILQADGTWTASPDLDWDQLPTRVAAVIAQRLERLDPDVRALLDVAAVEGEHFTAEVVAAVSGQEILAVCRALDRELGGGHGIVQSAGVEVAGARSLTRYGFRHVLFQQYVHDHLGDGELRHLHRRVGDALVALHDEADHDRIAPSLAHHYAAAQDREPAVTWAQRAGDRARAVYAHQEAILHYRRAADVLRTTTDDPRLARVLMKLGLSHQIAFDHPQAQAAYDEAFGLWRAPRQPDRPGESMATLRMLWGEPSTLDPTMGGYDTTAPIATQLFSGLVGWGVDNEVLPDVASSWRLADDGRRMVFHLRDDARWHDGEPVTAHDFVFTFRRGLAPATGAPVAPSLLSPVIGADRVRAGGAVDDEAFGVRALDDHTLEIELTQPTSWFLPNLAYYVLLPTPTHVVTAHGPDWWHAGTFVGNGPFRLGQWDHGTTILLERNPDHHGRSTGNVGRIELDLALTGEAIEQAYDRDELDVLTSFGVPPRQVAELARRHPADLRRAPAFITMMAIPDLARPPMDDPRIRRALALAIDRDAMVREILGGFGTPATGGVVPRGMPGHVEGAGIPHDPELAARLVAEAGPTQPIVLVSSPRSSLGPWLCRAWAEVGLDAHAEVVPPGEFDQVPAHVALGGWIADYPDPDTFLRVALEFAGSADWMSPDHRDLLAEAARATDQSHRLAMYEEVEHLLLDQALVIPLFYEDWQIMAKPWVHHYQVPAVKHPGFWQDIRVGPTPGS